MKDALRKDTQFWLVTPKASLAGVSGLDALVGGNYIGMMPGKASQKIISSPSIPSRNTVSITAS
jgi:paraquat-inducible protein B